MSQTQINPSQSKISIWINPNESEPIQIRINLIRFSIQIKPNSDRLVLIRIENSN